MARTAADLPPEQWRSRKARIERLKQRARDKITDSETRAVIAGILDLLGDEL